MYFNNDDIEVIDYCKSKNIFIYGMETFSLTGKGIESNMEHRIGKKRYYF